jgi:putative heme-binding domain-containing protein
MRFKAMKWMAAGLALGPLTLAQQKPAATVEINPLAHDEQAIGQGREIYNRTCTVCHGLDGAAGGRGPGLGAGRSYVLRTDEAIFGAIQKGIPGTEMPASGLQAMDIWKVVAYIRSLRATASEAFVPGDVARGEQVFWNKGQCGSCHMIRGRGGIAGPDLSNLAAEQTLKHIRDALTMPRQPIPAGYQPVEVITNDGQRLSGIAKNDNNFSLQMLDSHDQLQFFTSGELREVIYKEQSLMPSNYGKTLSAVELQDLVAFLSHQIVYKVERRRRSDDE